MFSNIPAGIGKTSEQEEPPEQLELGLPSEEVLPPLLIQIDLRDYAKWVEEYPDEYGEDWSNIRTSVMYGLQRYLKDRGREHEANLLDTLVTIENP